VSERIEKIIKSPGPKKILALDGGGIRGIATVEILGEIESMLRRQLRKGPRFVLGDYFDLIAGTSTGAIIATCLSLGMSVERIRKFYVNSGEQMFDKASLLKRYRYEYESKNLAKLLQHEVGKATTLGSDKLRTLLLIVMRNATTDSPWPLTNNPYAKYNARRRKDCNLDLPLWQLVRASTAAPVYFPPEIVSVGKTDFMFVDGGVTTYNNPAFLAFLTATLSQYRIGWATGTDEMLVVSVGTGSSPAVDDSLSAAGLIGNAKNIPSALMFAALNEQDMLCRVFGQCRVGNRLDLELGDLKSGTGPVSERLFTYTRYNFEATVPGLGELGLRNIDLAKIQALDAVENIRDLQRIGRAVGKKLVNADDYRAFL
jgi:patatin-like phospholipase/acyl hydrolase